MFTRKAPYHYGWDWGPRFVTAGIWRPAALEAWDEARLDDVQVFQKRLDATRRRAGGQGPGRRDPRRPRQGDGRPRGRRRARRGRGGGEARRERRPAGRAHRATRALVAERPRCAAPLSDRDPPGGRRRDGARRAAHPRRPADARGRAREGQGREELLREGERRAGVHEGGELDPGRQLHPAHHQRTLPVPAAVGRGSQHEHAPGVGRRRLRGRPLLRPLRRAGPAGVPGLHVRVQHVPGRRRVRRERAARGDRERAPRCATTRAWRSGPGNNENEAAWKGWGWQAKFNLSKKAQDTIWARLQADVPRGPARRRRRRGPGALLHAQLAERERGQRPGQQARLGRHALLGRLARREPVRGLRRQRLALHERIRVPVASRSWPRSRATRRARPTGTSRAR